jgi:hypothetical protein
MSNQMSLVARPEVGALDATVNFGTLPPGTVPLEFVMVPEKLPVTP